MATAIIALSRPEPRIATIASASSRLGTDRMMSIARMIRMSTVPRKNPESRPNRMPAASEMVTTMVPMNSE